VKSGSGMFSSAEIQWQEEFKEVIDYYMNEISDNH